MEPRLFRGSVVAFTVTAFKHENGYWYCHISTRHSGEGWSEGGRVEYDLMTTDELEDTLTSSLSVALGSS